MKNLDLRWDFFWDKISFTIRTDQFTNPSKSLQEATFPNGFPAPGEYYTYKQISHMPGWIVH